MDKLGFYTVSFGDKTQQIYFWYCERLIDTTDLEDSVLKYIKLFSLQHAYIHFGSDPWGEPQNGVGFSAGKKGGLPQNEKAFNPTQCKPCYIANYVAVRKLKYGKGKNKKCARQH